MTDSPESSGNNPRSTEIETLPGIGPLYTAATAAAAIAGDESSRDAIMRVSKALEAMTDDELFACLESAAPVGRGLGAADLPETTVRACAAFESRMRQARFFNAEARRSGWWQGLRAGVSWTLVLGLLATLIAASYLIS